MPVLNYTGEVKPGSTDFTITLTDALGGPGVLSYFAAGLSNTTYNGSPLPQALGGGCDLQVSLDFVHSQLMGGAPGPRNGTSSVLLNGIS